jgi:hypothetical protein
MDERTRTSSPRTSDRPRIGDPMPDLTLRTLDGEVFRTWSLQGTRALLFMWASW